MCQDDRLENFGSCRVCSVEVAHEKDGHTRTMASCHTPISAGLYIYHNTERIQKLRKNIVELILTDYPADKIFSSEDKKYLKGLFRDISFCFEQDCMDTCCFQK